MFERRVEELLILTKTYPSPSARYRETTCVAALTRTGELRRLFPVPFRFLSENSRFKRWHWIRAAVAKTEADHRPESRRIDADSIELLDESVSTARGWADRRELIDPHVVEDVFELEERRKRTGQTLGFVQPKCISELEVTASKQPDWTEEEKRKLEQEGLFDTHQMRDRVILRKVPVDFHYRYISGERVERHKILDWEAAALYWRCQKDHGPAGWERAFRQRLETEFSQKDLYFLMGTIHRFPSRWLIVGLIYPPKPPPKPAAEQLGLRLDQ